MRTTLESGAWVEHVPLQDLKYGHKRKLERVAKMSISRDAVDDDGNVSVREIVATMDLAKWTATRQDALWALLISDWSFDVPVPLVEGDEVIGADVLDSIPLDDATAIEELLAPHAAKLTRRPDPKGSTTPASNGSSPARAGSSRKG